MSNRILWILIILWFILSGILFYMYFFVYYMWNITVKTNIQDYKISLYNKELVNTKEINCPNKICDIIKVSPFKYSITISKKWYITKKEDIQVWRNEDLKLDFVLDKKIALNEIKINNDEKIEEILTNKEKISILRKKKGAFFSKNIKSIWNFYFKEKWNYNELYLDNHDLWRFERVNKEEIEIKEVLWNNDYFFIRLGKNKYLYSLIVKKKYPVKLNIKINYIKPGLSDIEFLFVTEKWTFVYDKFSLSLEYIYFFRDFVYYKSWYIWIVDKTDKRRLTNLWLEKETKNLIISYDTETKERKIIFKTDLDIIKIYKKWKNIMFVSSDNKEYNLENY